MMDRDLASNFCYPESSQLPPHHHPLLRNQNERTILEQPFLELRLNEWLKLEHLVDSFCTVRPPNFILSKSDASMCRPK